MGTAAATLSIGTLVRGVLTIAAVTIVLRVRAPSVTPLRRRFLALGIAGVVGPTLGLVRGGGFHDLLADFIDLSKILYAPGMIVLLLVLLRKTRQTLEDVLGAVALCGALAGLSIVGGNLIGIGLSTYQWQHTGFKGLFISQNELGLTMGISTFAAVQLLMSTGRLRYLMLAVATVWGMLLLGTRAATLGVFVAPTGVVVVNGAKLLAGRRRHMVVALVTLLSAGLAVAGVWEYQLIRQQRFEAEKFNALVSRDVVFVRGILLVGAVRYIGQRSIVANVVGEGPVRYQRGVAKVLHLGTDGKAAEVDWIDLIGGYGFIFMMGLYLFYASFLRRSVAIGEQYGRPLHLTVLMMIGWMLAHSLIAGHALGPMPAGTMAPLLAFVWLAGPRATGAVTSPRGNATATLGKGND